MTGIANGLEWYWHQQGYRLGPQGSLRRSLANAILWFQLLDERVWDYIEKEVSKRHSLTVSSRSSGTQLDSTALNIPTPDNATPVILEVPMSGNIHALSQTEETSPSFSRIDKRSLSELNQEFGADLL
ncbi:hypothetical protein M422DRAFT_270393 [Sphaerobolus stellatus SS14]|uniref:Uncharacterized protein n=1 Tax=Sphaerobolus stellatus (strain SS14) TaxID=990650 RepID=A0A0C9TFZ5_SPHS4|nr:hypothetical protein M422DRAFT_270393 [Sphaerobolus stellatus SS14]